MIAIEELYKLYLKHPSITKDTREDVSGCIYFALKGENFDGNSFAMEALQKGARYAIVDDDQLVRKDERLILVENCLDTLQKLAKYHRSRLNVPLLAITGSNGKTTTKELISAVLRKKYKLYSTIGNYNNHFGIPLSLLQVKGDTECIVLEMGASAQNEIRGYCEVARPDYGLITNIGKAHLEGFGGLEGVKKGKGELFDYLADHNGLAFVNPDEPFLNEMAKDIERKFFYRQSNKPVINRNLLEVQLLQTTPNIRLRIMDQLGNMHEVMSSLMGIYNFRNIMAALAVGFYFEVPVDEMNKAISSYRSTNNRSQIIEKGGITYLLDAYNANPSSMEASLRTFVEMTSGEKGVVLGDMLELGEYSLASHQAIIDLLKDMNDLSFVYLVGNEFEKANYPSSFHWFSDIQSLKDHWNEDKVMDHTIFIKGSRSMRLEKLLEK